MPDDSATREMLVQLLRGGHAHATFEAAIRAFPVDLAGARPNGNPHSAWELLEHMRLAQNDILQFCQSPDYVSPSWPEGYWPGTVAPPSQAGWRRSVAGFRADLAAFEALLRDPGRDLHEKFPWGDGQTLFREALLLLDHNAYHLGQLVLVRRLLSAWPRRG